MARRARRAARAVAGAARRVTTVVVAAPRAAARRVGSYAGRAVRRVGTAIQGRRQSSGLDLWPAVQQTAFASLGGAASSIVDAVTVATNTTFDDSPYTRLAIKCGAAIGIGYVAGKGRTTSAFTSGMIGHSAGVALDSIALNRVKDLIGSSGKK